jgi:hypothetical protein
MRLAVTKGEGQQFIKKHKLFMGNCPDEFKDEKWGDRKIKILEGVRFSELNSLVYMIISGCLLLLTCVFLFKRKEVGCDLVSFIATH